MTRDEEEAPAVATAQGFGFAKLNSTDCEPLPTSAQALEVDGRGTVDTVPKSADEHRAERDARDKAITSLRARAALAGFALHVVDDGNCGAVFLICRWNRSATLPDPAAVSAFLDRAGAPNA